MKKKRVSMKEIIERHDEGCRARCRMELAVVNRMLADAKAQGYTLTETDEGDGDGDLRDLIFNLDEARIEYSKDGKYVGTVLLMLGENGWDVISDYHISLDKVLKGALEVAEKLMERV